MLTIFLDAGHGMQKKRVYKDSRSGKEVEQFVLDIGTSGYKGQYNEAENTLAIAWELEKVLTAMGHVVVMGRKTPSGGVTLEERGKMAKNSGCSLAVSIHCDAAENTNAYEMRTYYRAAFGKNSDDYAIAYSIAASAPPMLKKTPPVIIGAIPKMSALPAGVAPRVFNVLRHHGDDYAAVLVECGFITHPQVGAYLHSNPGRKECAFGIATGIQAWFKNKIAFASPIAMV